MTDDPGEDPDVLFCYARRAHAEALAELRSAHVQLDTALNRVMRAKAHMNDAGSLLLDATRLLAMHRDREARQ